MRHQTAVKGAVPVRAHTVLVWPAAGNLVLNQVSIFEHFAAAYDPLGQRRCSVHYREPDKPLTVNLLPKFFGIHLARELPKD